MTHTFEIIVYENNKFIEYHTESVNFVINKFIDLCKFYINPSFIPQEKTIFAFSKCYAYYSNKIKTVIIIGPFNLEMIRYIEKNLYDLYPKTL